MCLYKVIDIYTQKVKAYRSSDIFKHKSLLHDIASSLTTDFIHMYQKKSQDAKLYPKGSAS